MKLQMSVTIMPSPTFERKTRWIPVPVLAGAAGRGN